MRKLVLALPLLLSACAPADTRSPAEQHDVTRLFTVDGCTVYRFFDGATLYFTSCSGEVSWQRREGKSSRSFGVPTVRRKS